MGPLLRDANGVCKTARKTADGSNFNLNQPNRINEFGWRVRQTRDAKTNRGAERFLAKNDGCSYIARQNLKRQGRSALGRTIWAWGRVDRIQIINLDMLGG